MSADGLFLDEIVKRVLSVSSPEKIILFGSAAGGSMHADSDIDLLIVEPDPVDRRSESVRIDMAMSGLGYPVDVIVVSSEYFARTRDIIGGIAYPADKYGKVIYDAS